MPRKKQSQSVIENIARTLAELESGVESAQELAAKADLVAPEKLANELMAIKETWMDRPPLFEGDLVLMEKLRESYARSFVTMMDTFELILTKIHARVRTQETPEGEKPLDIHAMLRIFESFGNQIASFRSAQKPPAEAQPTVAALPATVDELDRQIHEAEAEKARRTAAR